MTDYNTAPDHQLPEYRSMQTIAAANDLWEVLDTDEHKMILRKTYGEPAMPIAVEQALTEGRVSRGVPVDELTPEHRRYAQLLTDVLSKYPGAINLWQAAYPDHSSSLAMACCCDMLGYAPYLVKTYARRAGISYRRLCDYTLNRHGDYPEMLRLLRRN